MSKDLADLLESKLGVHPDFPIKGINFRDIFPIFRDPIAVESLISAFVNQIYGVTLPKSGEKKVDVVIGLDARGFLMGPTLALRLRAAFVPVRKPGKLPGECYSVTYQKEYGVDSFEMQKDAITPGQTIVVVDDLLATGGSAFAAGELAKLAGGKVLEYLFVIEGTFLHGKDRLDADTYSIIKIDHE